MTAPDPAVVAHAIRELRTATECTCPPGSVWTAPLHHPSCRALWREDVDTLAAELERLRRVDELARALVEKWESMNHCYQSTEESVALAELLDALANEVES